MIQINKIYNESCLSTMKKMPDNSIDLVFTSPPYNMRLRVMNNKYKERERKNHFSKKYSYFDDAIPIDDFYQFHKEVLSELLRVSKIVCYNFQIVTGSKEAFFKLIGDFNTNIKDILIWDKGNGQPAMHEKILNSCYENILILENDSKKGRLINNAKFDRGCMDNILRIGRGKKESDINGATFPEKLAYKIINAFSDVDALIYDPFMGSGTTAVVCEKTNRRWIGSELIKEQKEQADKRLEPLQNNLFT